MEEKKNKFKDKNQFKINFIFNENGESLEKLIEKAFKKYCSKKYL